LLETVSLLLTSTLEKEDDSPIPKAAQYSSSDKHDGNRGSSIGRVGYCYNT